MVYAYCGRLPLIHAGGIKPVSLNRLRIYELIAYHDLLEAETGDIDLDPSMQDFHKSKMQLEEDALPVFVKKIPNLLQERFLSFFNEYEQRITLESKFVKVVDIVECELQCLFHKELFENWTREYFIDKRERHFLYFPELIPIYQEILSFYDVNGYFH